MPRVLRIINRFNLGGPTFNAAYLTRYLNPDFETMLIGGEKCETEDSSTHIVEGLGIEPVIIPEMRRNISPINDRKAYKKIKQIIQDFKPDIVHTHASKAGAIGRLAASDLKVPVVLHTFHGHVFHSYFNAVKTEFYRKIERYLASKSTGIIAISDKQKEELVSEHQICAENKVHVVPLGFDLHKFREDQNRKREAFRKRYNIEDDELAIGIVGRLVPIKNHPLFISAIKKLMERSNKKVRAFIVGDGEERKNLEQLVSQLKLSFIDGVSQKGKSDVTFTSWIKEVDFVYAGLDIVCLTSKNEGTPVSLIEAQASNKPIVTTNVGGIENIVLPGETALLCEKCDEDKFSDLLFELVENDTMRKQMGKSGWNHVESRFHYSRLISDMSELYFSLLN